MKTLSTQEQTVADKAEVQRLWALLGNMATHNVAIIEIARAPRSVRDFLDAQSAKVAQAFYASPENNT